MKNLIIILLGLYGLYSLFPEQVLSVLEAITQQLNYLAANPGILG